MKLTPELMAAICARHLTARETQEMGQILLTNTEAFRALVNAHRGETIGDEAAVARFLLRCARQARRGVGVS